MEKIISFDLDKSNTIPDNPFGYPYRIRLNNRIIVENSIIENIDCLTPDNLEYLLKKCKNIILPICTSIYIPSPEIMNILRKYAPEFKVRFKYEKSGTSPIIPINPEEFFRGEEIFNKIISDMPKNLNELEKFKYLYNQTGLLLSYNLDILESSKHKDQASNIFISIVKNWGICSSFARIYEYLCYKAGLECETISEEGHDYNVITTEDGKNYLADPTFDSFLIKFGLPCQNFAISPEEFEKNDHNLNETETDTYAFSSLTKDFVQDLDKQIGFYDLFNGDYQSESIQSLTRNLKGKNNFEKTEDFIKKILSLKTCGRITLSDYQFLISMILKQDSSEWKKSLSINTYRKDYNPNTTRKLIISVEDNNQIKHYLFSDDFKSYSIANSTIQNKSFEDR